MAIYIASPYNASTCEQMERNHRDVSTYAARLIAMGEIAISPIAYGHHLLDLADMPATWEFWNNFCHGILKGCDTMHVLMLPGWERSAGVGAEIDFAKSMGIPIVYVPALSARISAEGGEFWLELSEIATEGERSVLQVPVPRNIGGDIYLRNDENSVSLCYALDGKPKKKKIRVPSHVKPPAGQRVILTRCVPSSFTSHHNALKEDDLVAGEAYLRCIKTGYMNDGTKFATKGYFYRANAGYTHFASEAVSGTDLVHGCDERHFMEEYFRKWKPLYSENQMILAAQQYALSKCQDNMSTLTKVKVAWEEGFKAHQELVKDKLESA